MTRNEKIARRKQALDVAILSAKATLKKFDEEFIYLAEVIENIRHQTEAYDETVANAEDD